MTAGVRSEDPMNSFKPRKAAGYQVGDRVTQRVLGDGTVTSVDTIHTTVDFDRCGPRTLRSEVAMLSPAPTSTPRRRASD